MVSNVLRGDYGGFLSILYYGWNRRSVSLIEWFRGKNYMC